MINDSGEEVVRRGLLGVFVQQVGSKEFDFSS